MQIEENSEIGEKSDDNKDGFVEEINIDLTNNSLNKEQINENNDNNINNLLNTENRMANNINNEQININTKDEQIKKKMEIKTENQIEINNKNSLSKSLKLMESWSQTIFEEIPPIFPLNNKQITQKISLFDKNNSSTNNNSSNLNKINNMSNNSYNPNINSKIKNDIINPFQNLSQENHEDKNNRISKISKEKFSPKKEERNLFEVEYDLLDGEIITEEELKRFDLNQIILRFIDVLYKEADKIKKKEELRKYDEKIIKIANMIIYMKSSNRMKVLECLRKTVNSYNKKKIFETLEKKVEEFIKIKKYGIGDYSNISRSSNLSRREEKGYSTRISDAKYYK